MKQTSIQALNTAAQAIYDKKGFNILSLDIQEISSLTNYVIIAEGNIDRHLSAISRNVQESLSQIGYTPLYVEGERTGDWVVLDYGDIVIHLLLSDFREKYALEQLWNKAKIVDLNIITHSLDEGWE